MLTEEMEERNREQAIEHLAASVKHARPALEEYLKTKHGLNGVFAYALQQRVLLLQYRELCRQLLLSDRSIDPETDEDTTLERLQWLVTQYAEPEVCAAAQAEMSPNAS